MCRVAISTLFGKRKKDTDWVFRVIGGLDRVGAVCQFQQISLSFISFRQRLRIPLVNCALKSSHFFFSEYVCNFYRLLLFQFPVSFELIIII